MFRRRLLIFFVITFLVQSNAANQNVRKKRLIWPGPTGSKILVILGMGIPAEYKLDNIIFGSLIKGNYILPSNVSDYYPDTYKRKRRSLNRWDIYSLLSQISTINGFEGKSCILRLICEIAENPLDKHFGFFSEIFHLMFSPSRTAENLNSYSDNEYYAAEILGRKGECNQFLRECSTSLFDASLTFTL